MSDFARRAVALPGQIAAVASRLEDVLRSLEPGDANRYFCSTYLRTTVAVGEALGSGLFADPEWVERWDVAFAGFYLDAIQAQLRGEGPSGPWTVAFTAASAQPSLPPLRHVLLGINAHINYDLPQALLAVMSDDDFEDPGVRALRARDHEAIDKVLRREWQQKTLSCLLGPASLVDRALTPLNQLASRRFLKEARQKVWSNAVALSRARRLGSDELARRLAELSELSVARLENLVAPGQVLLKLAAEGFGVQLSPALRAGALPARRPPPARSFSPQRVGALERDAWVAYYQHRWARFLVPSVRLVRAGFGMPPIATLRGAWHVLQANRLWAPFPDNDADGARCHMERFYGLLTPDLGSDLDPKEAARLEVEWWRAHRALQRYPGDQEANEAELARALTDLYAYVFKAAHAEVAPAARERAAAMVLSDSWVAEGSVPSSPYLEAEGAALVRSYAALLAVVQR